MKAIVYREYGGPEVLHVSEVEKPTPGENEILVNVRASSVNYGDLLSRNVKNATSREFNMPLFMLPMVKLMLGYSKPKRNILGSEFSGVVESVGGGVTRFIPGDEVYVHNEMNFGGYAEYINVSADGLVAKKPASLSFAQAAATPMGALTALCVLRKVDIESDRTRGKDILVNGASGSIGGFAVQIAKAYGANVTGVCGAPRLDYVKALGADEVIDYKAEDFTARKKKYDIILDVLGKSSFSKCRDSLKPDGIYLLASFRLAPVLWMLWTSLTGGQKVICAMSSYRQEYLETISQMVEQGKLTLIVNKTYPMEQAAEAHRYCESGQKKGNVVITMGAKQ